MKTRVVHCKKEPFDIYIGRKCYGFAASKWANPFSIGLDGTRDEVLEKHRNWLMFQAELLASLSELKGKTLGCWCSDVLVKT